MNEIDWIELWLLNELALVGSHLSRLVHHPGDDSSQYWAFPSRIALGANADARIAALRAAVNQGLIELYSDSWLTNTRISSARPCANEAADYHNEEFLDQTLAMLTLRGHEKWETDFQPDWTRFWCVDSENDDLNRPERVITVVYAGNEILDELIRWFPAYWGLDGQAGLKQLECYTRFRYQATSWMVLPFVKVITWKAQDRLVRSNELLRAAFKPGLPADDAVKQEAMEKLKRYQETQIEEHSQAKRILTRLSKKWDSVGE